MVGMGSHHPPMRSLILLGGQSSRMGSPKYLLLMPSEVSEAGDETPLLIQSLYLHHIFQVKHGDPLLRTVTLSVRDQSQCDEIKTLLKKYENDLPLDLKINYVQDGQGRTGPAAGLIAASRLDTNAHWLVTGCDYPRTSRLALEELRDLHHREKKSVTCYVDSEDHPQPLFAIWTGAALGKLEGKLRENVEMDLALDLNSSWEDADGGKDKAAYMYGVAKVKPSTEDWLTSINTKEEWDQVVKTFQTKYDLSDP